jgi:tRNA threonylcarbamoyladenosine biosynthesis protein TsaB
VILSPIILAMDTTREFGSIALTGGDGTIDEILLHAEDGFGHVLYGHLSSLLGRHGLRVEDIDCFAAASGPGSFTGVRVGLACVKGLAEACGKPVAPVSNLQALAAFGSEPLRATMLDARRGEIYGAVYDAEARLQAPEVVMPLPRWLAGLPVEPLEFISADAALLEAALEGTRFAGSAVKEAPRALAGAIGRIALDRFRRGLAVDPAGVDANYVRRSDAELFWKES